MLRMNKQELIYNLTSVYYKIYQLEKLLEATKASVRQLEAHKRNVELFLKAGTVPKVELLKTEVELAHAKQNVLAVKNSLESAYELLKTLMGIEDTNKKYPLFMKIGQINILPLKKPLIWHSLRDQITILFKEKEGCRRKGQFSPWQKASQHLS